MKKVSAYCPAALGFIFKIRPNEDKLKMGSIGIGFTVNKGVSVTVESGRENSIILNSLPIHFPTVISVIDKLKAKNILLNIQSELPLGYGFGISGASALATALAVNKYLKLKFSLQKLAEIAHTAEIENKTGLGSIATQSTGGFLVKTAPGIPPKFTKLPFIGKKIYITIINRLITSEVLKNQNQTKIINKSADEALSKIRDFSKLTLEKILDISYKFAANAGLFKNKKALEIINDIKKTGQHASMLMLGHVVISNKKVNSRFESHELIIADDKARLI